MAMVNYPYSTGFLAPLPPNPISEFCARFNGSYDDDNKLLDVKFLDFFFKIFLILSSATFFSVGSSRCHPNLFQLHRPNEMFEHRLSLFT